MGVFAEVTRGILVPMSQVDRDRATSLVDDASSDEGVWLEEQLDIYRDLLAYLHDH